AGTHGVRVFRSPTRDWVGTRKIWNQHSYHVTNVAEDGSVPRGEPLNWQNAYLNNFRQNVQPGATNLPNPQAVDGAVDISQCPDTMVLNVRVFNDGWSAIPIGTPVTFYVSRNGMFVAIGTANTQGLLLPGQSEIVTLSYALQPGEEVGLLAFRAVVNEASDPMTITECDDTDNAVDMTANCVLN